MNQDKGCPYCGGHGFTTEHNPEDPHINGICESCPIQVQCEICKGTGKIKTMNQDKTVKEVKDIVSDEEIEKMFPEYYYGPWGGDTPRGNDVCCTARRKTAKDIRDLIQSRIGRELAEAKRLIMVATDYANANNLKTPAEILEFYFESEDEPLPPAPKTE